MGHFSYKKEHLSKIYTPEDTVGHHVFISLKALNTECWDLVLFVYTASVFGKFCTRMNLGNEIGQSVMVFCKPCRRITRLNNENVSYMHLSQLCSQSFGLGVGLFNKSRNNTLYQNRKN